MSLNKNEFFKRAFTQAKESFGDKRKILNTLNTAVEKALYLENANGEVTGLVEKVKLFIIMLRAYFKGEYKEIPWKSISLILAGLIYFVNPLDLVSDFIPVIGYVDDFTVVLWVFKSVEEDVNRFQEHYYGPEISLKNQA